MIKLFLSLLIVVLVISCNSNKVEKLSNPLVLKDGLLYSDSLSTIPFTGRNKSHMLDMKIEYDVVNGVKEGAFITYFPNDKVQMSGTMKNNKNVGEWKYYFPNGSIETIGYFDNDTVARKWTWYNQSGKIIEEGNFIDGLREGEWNSYNSSGLLSIIRTYKEDKLIDSTIVD